MSEFRSKEEIKKKEIETGRKELGKSRPFKPLERFIKKGIISLIRLFVDNHEPVGKINLKNAGRVLIIRNDVIGDMYCTMPFFKYVKLLNPDIELDVVASDNNKAVISHDEYINNIYITGDKTAPDFKLFKKLRKKRYDVILNAKVNNLTIVGFYLNFISPKGYKCIFSVSGKKHVFFNVNAKVSPDLKSEWERIRDFAIQTFDNDGDIDYPGPYMFIDKKFIPLVDERLSILQGRPFIVVNLTVRRAANCWQSEKYIEFTRHIIRNYDVTVLPLYLKQEQYLADEMAQLLAREENSKGSFEQTPPVSHIHESAEIVRRAKLIFTPDTGIVHLAAAVGTPVITLAAGHIRNIEYWHPWGVKYVSIHANPKGIVADIKPEQVIEEFDKFYIELL